MQAGTLELRSSSTRRSFSRRLAAVSVGRRRDWAGWLFLAPALAVSCLFVIYPVFDTIYLSFTTAAGSFAGLQNYRELFASGGDAVLVLQNTGLWAAMTIPGTIAAALLLALVMDRAFRGRVVYRAVFFLPAILSPVVIAFAWSWIFNPQVGLVSKVLEFFGGSAQGWLQEPSVALPIVAAVEIWRVAGLFMLFYLAAMQLIPGEYYEAASLDGASGWRKIRSITLPLLLPITSLLVLFATINALNEFQMIWNLTQGGPNNATSVASVSIYQNAFVDQAPQLAACMATLLLAIGVVAAIALLRLNARVGRSLR